MPRRLLLSEQSKKLWTGSVARHHVMTDDLALHVVNMRVWCVDSLRWSRNDTIAVAIHADDDMMCSI